MDAAMLKEAERHIDLLIASADHARDSHPEADRSRDFNYMLRFYIYFERIFGFDLPQHLEARVNTLTSHGHDYVRNQISIWRGWRHEFKHNGILPTFGTASHADSPAPEDAGPAGKPGAPKLAQAKRKAATGAIASQGAYTRDMLYGSKKSPYLPRLGNARGMDLRGADLRGYNMRGVEGLRHAKLEGAIIDETQAPYAALDIFGSEAKRFSRRELISLLRDCGVKVHLIENDHKAQVLDEIGNLRVAGMPERESRLMTNLAIRWMASHAAGDEPSVMHLLNATVKGAHWHDSLMRQKEASSSKNAKRPIRR